MSQIGNFVELNSPQEVHLAQLPVRLVICRVIVITVAVVAHLVVVIAVMDLKLLKAGLMSPQISEL